MTPRSLSTFTVVFSLLAMGAAPALAGGSWLGGVGDLEPSTSYDSDAFMQQHANDADHPEGLAERIYFNGFAMNYDGDINAEGGSIRSSITRFAAVLGYWRDCNGDGYIGAKNAPTPYGNWDTGAYPADAYPIDADVCPQGSPYNQGAIVDEFRWIGPQAAATDSEVANQKDCDPADWSTIIAWCLKQWRDPEDVSDPEAKVWVDFNRPDSQAATTGSFTPGYLFQNSSGTLEYVNWFTDVESRYDGLQGEGAWDEKPNFGHCDGETDDEFMSGEAFLGVTGTCGLYPLWQANRVENDSRSADERPTPIVRVYDTESDDDESGSACDDTTLPTGHQMADPDPDVHDNPLMRGSVGGTRQNVEEATSNREFDGECGAPDPNSSGGSDGPVEGKNSVDDVLFFRTDKRLQTARAAGVEYVPVGGFGLTGGPNSPGGSDFILFATSAGPRWYGGAGYVTTGVPRGYTGPDFASFYADVGVDSFTNATYGGASPSTALPSGVQDAHTYGSLQCGGDFGDSPENQEPNAYGWLCSRDAWSSENYYPGITFDFRDVDCYDNSPVSEAQWTDVQNPATGEMVRSTCETWRSG